MAKVSVNNQWIELTETTLGEALHAWNYRREKYAVAVNGEFVPRSAYREFTLHDGDKVDVVAAVGGG